MASKKSAPANGSTPFDDPPATPAETTVPAPSPAPAAAKKRYTPTMDAIHKIGRLLDKLTVAEQAQVYLHFRNQFQPELSFMAPVPKQGA